MTDHLTNNGTDRAAKIEALLIQSRGTDIPVLLKAKEAAKKAVSEDPSNPNLAALQRATKMLETAQMTTENENTSSASLRDVSDVLFYLQEQGRKVGRAKLYKDINKGLLARSKDLTFARPAVDKYATTLPMSATPEHVSREVSALQRRKDEAEVRIREAEARKKELSADVAEGKYIARDVVEQELAARAVALNAGLKTDMEARSQELIAAVGGNPQQAHHFLRLVEEIVDGCSNRYAQPLELEVSFDGNDSVDSDTE